MLRNSEDFRAWMMAMGRKRGRWSISAREAERELGYSRASIAAILEGRRRVPRLVALACRAALYDVPEVDPEEMRNGPPMRARLVPRRAAGE